MGQSIFSWNVNGLRSVLKKGTLQNFVHAYQPDILCMQEVRTHPEQADYEFPEYTESWCIGQKKGYSGTAIFSRTPPLAVQLNFSEAIADKFQLNVDPFGDPNQEGRVLSAEFADFWVVNVYTPNSKPDLSRLKLRKEQWDPAFLEHLKTLEMQKPVITCGDFNVAHQEIDLSNPKQNKGKHGFTDEERLGFSALTEAGYIDTFRHFEPGGNHYTWWSNFAKSRERNVGWRIDYVLASNALKNRLQAARIHADVLGSDHCPISLVLS